MNHKISDMSNLGLLNILDAEYKQETANLDDFIQTCRNFLVEEQYQLKILVQKYDCEATFSWNIRRIQNGTD
jgi:hypothetical protein